MRRTITLVCLLAAALVVPAPARASACGAPPHPDGEWPSYGRDLSNTRSQASGPSSPTLLEPAWSFSARAAGGAGDFTGTPITSGGCVFVGSNMGWIFAIDADSGASVWATELPNEGTVNNTLAAHGGRIYAFVSRVSSPYVVALDQSTGDILWETTVDSQEGSDAFSSPAVFDGLVLVGISGDAAQHSDAGDLVGFRGSFVLLDAEAGAILRKTPTIPDSVTDGRYAGATVTTTAAVDPVRKVAYEGTGSAFLPQFEHANANALLKVDVDPQSATFGEILQAYKGDTFDAVVPGYSSLDCTDLPDEVPPPPPIIPTGRGVGACGDVDVDFAASPNLFTDAAGRRLLADSQKSGTFHAVDAETMDPVWRARFSSAQPFGGSSAASAGGRLFASAAAPAGYAFSLDGTSGALEWTSPIPDAAHYGLPVAHADGVVYVLGVAGTLSAFDAETGLPLLHRPILAGGDSPLTFGGVSVARGTVYAAVGAQNTGIDFAGALNGYVVAFRS